MQSPPRTFGVRLRAAGVHCRVDRRRQSRLRRGVKFWQSSASGPAAPGKLRQIPAELADSANVKKNSMGTPGGVDKNSGGAPADPRGALPKLTPMKTPPELCRSFHQNYFWWSFGGAPLESGGALPEFLLTTPGASAESTLEASMNSCRSEVTVESKSPRQSRCGVDSAYYNASHFTKTIYYISNYNYKNSISEQLIENKLQAPTTCLRPPRTVQYWYLYYDP